MITYFWLLASALAAGAINSIAGGGTLLTFPALGSVIDLVAANGTSTVALTPGSLAGAWGYRKQLLEARRWFYILVGPSVIGGIIGTRLVIEHPNSFKSLVPWLILSAALLFLVQPLTRRLRRHDQEQPPTDPLRVTGIVLFQTCVAIYGGYFGAGIGILMLSGLSLLGLTHIHQMNALKNLLGTCINGSACVVWIMDGQVAWQFALPMMGAAIVGGYVGATLAQRIPQWVVRWMVILIGFTLAGFYFFF